MNGFMLTNNSQNGKIYKQPELWKGSQWEIELTFISE
jgi:hypothetical protein